MYKQMSISLQVISSNLFRKCNTEHSEPLEKHQELEVFLKYHVSIGNFLDFSHVDHQNYIFLDPCVIGDELNVIYNIEKNEKQSKPSPYKEAVIQKSSLLQYLALDRVKGQGQVILGYDFVIYRLTPIFMEIAISCLIYYSEII